MTRTVNLAFTVILLAGFAVSGAQAQTQRLAQGQKPKESCNEFCFKFCQNRSSGSAGGMNICLGRCNSECEAQRARGK